MGVTMKNANRTKEFLFVQFYVLSTNSYLSQRSYFSLAWEMQEDKEVLGCWTDYLSTYKMPVDNDNC